MPDWLYDCGPNGLWIFLLLTVILGGAAAWATGRAIAATWRPLWQVPIYGLLLAVAVRFLHFALFEEPLLAVGNFLVSALVLLSATGAGYRLERVRAMTTQYDWVYVGAGRFGWQLVPEGKVDPARDSG